MNGKLPLITVIVPVYNVEQYLEKCVDSIIGQTYRNLEIILVDDGSTDRCGVLCDKYADADPRIVVIHKKNGGLSEARNVGLENTTGQFISFVDSDDVIDPEMIEVMINRLVEDGTELALCGFKRVEQEGQIVREITLPDSILSKFRALEISYQENGVLLVSACNKIYKKELFNSIRFPGGCYHEDEYTFYKILDQCHEISIIQQPLYVYNARNGSIMSSEYSVQRLDGIEASYLRYCYYKEKGGEYIQFLQPECDVFTPLYFKSKMLFKPESKEEKQRVKQIDRMARAICFDQFSKWTLMRKARLMIPKVFVLMQRIKAVHNVHYK